MPPGGSTLIQLDDVSKVYRTRSGEVRALSQVSLGVERGEFVVVRGPSGSGKSTLLLTIGGMARPTGGSVLVAGSDVYALPGRKRAELRARDVGFVFQMFHLVPYLSVLENVVLPTGPAPNAPGVAAAAKLLARFGMSDRVMHKPWELSVGERQRVAVARALVNDPRLVLADEPTGNLDPENAAEILRHLAEYHSEGGTVLVVTHGDWADSYAHRTLLLRGGRIEDS